MTLQGIRWSPRPITVYQRVVRGRAVGPGTNPRLIASLAAWNLYWLSYPELEEDLGRDQAAIHLELDALAPLALQTAAGTAGGASVADLARQLEPAAFAAEIGRRAVEHLPLAKLYSPVVWLDLMATRAELFSASRLTTHEDGTTRTESTNILRLVHRAPRLLH